MKNVSVWEQLTKLPYLSVYSRLLCGAMELDVFSHLTVKTTSAQLAAAQGWNEANTEALLAALTSVGFLDKEGDFYRNTWESSKYLVRGRPDYLGGYLLSLTRPGAMELPQVAALVREGPQPAGTAAAAEPDYDRIGSILRQAQEGCRQQEILRLVRTLPENRRIRRILDLGCAAGLLGLAVIGDRVGRTGVLFDRLPVSVLQKSIDSAGLTSQAEARSGDFMTDDLGDGYDLILGVGVMLYAGDQMESLLKKLRAALKPGGVVLLVSEGLEPDLTGPWDMVLRDLPCRLQGRSLALVKGQIAAAARAAGFSRQDVSTEHFCSGMQDVILLRN